MPAICVYKGRKFWLLTTQAAEVNGESKLRCLLRSGKHTESFWVDAALVKVESPAVPPTDLPGPATDKQRRLLDRLIVRLGKQDAAKAKVVQEKLTSYGGPHAMTKGNASELIQLADRLLNCGDEAASGGGDSP